MLATVLLALVVLYPVDNGPALPLATHQITTTKPITGFATFYASGVMERVYGNRIAMGLAPCPDCIGQVAVRDADNIGRKVWMKVDGMVVGPYLVTDCASERDKLFMDRRRRIVELSYEEWIRLGLPMAPSLVEMWYDETR